MRNLTIYLAIVTLMGVTGCSNPLGPLGWDYGATIVSENEWSLQGAIGNTDGWYSGDNLVYAPAYGEVSFSLPGQGIYPSFWYRVGTNDYGPRTYLRFNIEVKDGAPNPIYKIGRDGKVYQQQSPGAGLAPLSSDTLWTEVPSEWVTE